ncbi:MAG: hypothetical protein JRE23_15285 [Deltaproteobacteria bacterium]|nr:hypothetical protein [Deltaproteobacteria bacterium]
MMSEVRLTLRKLLTIAFVLIPVLLIACLAFGQDGPEPEFPYRSFLPYEAHERSYPIQATERILKERETFLGVSLCNYRVDENNIAPYRGRIEADRSGYVVIVLGYHYLEKPWGRIFKNEFQKNILDPQNRILFLEIQNNNILTGDDSPASNREIREFLANFQGKVRLVIEVHEHLSDASVFCGNEWPPYWYDLDNRTGADHRIKYTILDPCVPWFCIRDYFANNQRICLSEMQRAVNETLCYANRIINAVFGKNGYDVSY